MKCSVLYAKRAVDDLKKISKDIFDSCLDKNTTSKYKRDLKNKIKRKTLFPNSGTPLYFMGLFTGFRYTIYKSYIAFYRVTEDKIIVERILPAKSDYCSTLFN
jgi:plasmid stabilization system protein ParE